jgi:GTP cyclohydrolase III
MENVSSILEKTRADIMLATASGMSTTDTTDAIQAIMNQFELNAKGTAERIADTLEKVSANMPMD